MLILSTAFSEFWLWGLFSQSYLILHHLELTVEAQCLRPPPTEEAILEMQPFVINAGHSTLSFPFSALPACILACLHEFTAIQRGGRTTKGFLLFNRSTVLTHRRRNTGTQVCSSWILTEGSKDWGNILPHKSHWLKTATWPHLTEKVGKFSPLESPGRGGKPDASARVSSFNLHVLPVTKRRNECDLHFTHLLLKYHYSVSFGYRVPCSLSEFPIFSWETVAWDA